MNKIKRAKKAKARAYRMYEYKKMMAKLDLEREFILNTTIF